MRTSDTCGIETLLACEPECAASFVCRDSHVLLETMSPRYSSVAAAIFVRLFYAKVSTGMIDTILDACQEVLEINGDPQSAYWLASQMMEMRLWRASEHDVRAALDQDIDEKGERSLFVKVADDEYALRSWAKS